MQKNTSVLIPVDGGGSSDSAMRRGPRLKMPVNSTDRKLETGLCRSRHGLRLHLPGILARFSSSHFDRFSCASDRVGLQLFIRIEYEGHVI